MKQLASIASETMKQYLRFLYFSIPFVLFILQAIYTFNSLNQIRYEELEESVVNPYWVANGYVQNGATSNLAWYFLMGLVYKIFGFSLFIGKFVRLGIYLIFLISLAKLLKKYLGEKLSILPLITIGLSPTLLYFNTQQTIYGLDMEYFVISLYLLSISPIIFSFFLMFAWLTYPSFIYYLPALFFLMFYQQFRRGSLRITKILIYILAFLFPLLVSFFAVSNRHLLIYDQITRSGIFRGAGFFKLEFNLFLENLRLYFINLFLYHFGYYYEIEKVEFSDFYPILSLIFIIFTTIYIFKKIKRLRVFIALAASILFFNILLANFTIDPTPGIRRHTGTLVSIYSLFVLAWYFTNNLPSKLKKFKRIFIFFCSLLLLHHITVYSINYTHLKDQSQFNETVWFNTITNPRGKFNQYIDTIQKEDLKLSCFDSSGKPLNCRYSEIFASVKAACLWNKLTCHDIYGYDLKTKGFIKLEIKLFNEYYFGLYGREIIAT